MKFSLSNNKLDFSFENSIRPVMSFDKEVEQACEDIRVASIFAGKPIWLMLSGGVDSELIAGIFLKQKIPFSCLIVRFKDDLNKHDIEYALKFVTENNIPHIIHDMDIIHFMNDCRIKPEPVCNLIYRFMQMEWMTVVNKMGGYCVIGSGEQRYNQNMKLSYTFGQLVPMIWQKNNNIDACPYFFLQNPAIINSFALDASLYKGDVGDLGHNIKTAIYKKYWPGLIERQKFTGYEKVQNLRNLIELELSQKYPYMDNKVVFTN